MRKSETPRRSPRTRAPRSGKRSIETLKLPPPRQLRDQIRLLQAEIKAITNSYSAIYENGKLELRNRRALREINLHRATLAILNALVTRQTKAAPALSPVTSRRFAEMDAALDVEGTAEDFLRSVLEQLKEGELGIVIDHCVFGTGRDRAWDRLAALALKWKAEDAEADENS